jgi:hypothetical protein
MPSLALSYELSDIPEPRCGKSSPIQKGLIPRFSKGGPGLCEEGLGFGVPILQYWRDFYFPGTGQVVKPDLRLERDWEKRFQMNLVERFHRQPSPRMTRFSWVVPRLHNWMYKSPMGRQFLSLIAAANGVVPPVLGWAAPQPGFYRVTGRGEVRTIYRHDAQSGDLIIVVDLNRIARKALQRTYVSNELGGSHFTEYWDSSGLHLIGDSIGPWNHIHGRWAVFYAPKLNWGFRIQIPHGITAFRGREAFQRHGICWSGVILMLPVSTKRLVYRVGFGSSSLLTEGENG